MKKPFFGLISLVLGMILIVGTIVHAAGAGQIPVSATVQKIGTLTLTSTNYSFGNVDPTQSPITKASAQTLTVKTNDRNWTLTQYMDADFAKDAGNNKLTLQWVKNGSSPLANMSTNSATPDTLVVAGGPTASQVTALDYGLIVPWTLTPATYRGSITYTLITP